jgi:hypothetical protein
VNVNLEFFFTKIFDRTVSYWKNTIDISGARTNPDDIVLQILENKLKESPEILKEDYIVHSTSWRYEERDSIVLTYLIYSDFMDFGNNKIKNMPFSNLRLAISTSHKRPRPKVITEENVISHAIRHLAFLIKNGNHDGYKKSLSKETLRKLKELKDIPAGEI